MDKSNLRDLLKKCWSNSWPMILIMFFEFLINMADVYIAGKISKEVQASIGLVSQIYFIFVVIANSITVGTVSVISRIFTSHKKDEVSTSVFSVISTTVVSGVILSLLGIFLSGRIINFLNVPQVVKTYSIPLVLIYSAGIVFHYLLINTNGILRATKMIKRSLSTMTLVCILNITLNFIFVFYTSMGFRGIALSTVLSIVVGSVMNMFHVSKLIHLRRYSFQVIKRVFSIGWASGVLQVGWQLGATILFLIVGNLPEKSVEVMAAFTNGMRVEALIFLPAFAFNMANAVVVGNLLGESKKNEAFYGGLYTAVMGVGLITVLTAIVIIFAKPTALFLSKNDIVIAESIRYLYISMIGEPFMAFGVILGGGLNGAGDTRSVMVRVISSLWLVRLPSAYVFGILLGFGASGIWWSMNFSIFAQAFLIGRYYFKREWLRSDGI